MDRDNIERLSTFGDRILDRYVPAGHNGGERDAEDRLLHFSLVPITILLRDWGMKADKYYKTERTRQMPREMQLELIVAIVATIVLLALLIWGARNPLVWRIMSVLGMGTGAGFLVWGILLATTKDVPAFISPAGIIGIGAGVLVASIALLVISFCGSYRGRKE